ncbi:MAG: hypothetical protein H0V30_03610 [Chitinophagaceae bacterium]|jgi:hypothetical protein|nr:hypothetical protein [Chitinophagaceae bacterium]
MQSSLYYFINLLLFLVNALFLNAQQDKFIQLGTIHDVHVLYSYQKSNWDGSNASQVFLYIKDTNRMESFKWSEGNEWATLVSAGFNWNELWHHLKNGRNLFL